MNRAAEPHVFDVALHVSRQEVEIAEPVELTIRASAPPGWQILPPVMPGDWQGFRVIGSSETTEQTKDHIVWTRHVKLEAYEAGQKTISPIEVTFTPPRLPSPSGRGAGGEGAQPNAPNRSAKSQKVQLPKAKTAPTEIYVRNALGLFESGTELRSIYDAVSVPWTWRQWAIAATCSALILGCGLLGIRWVNRFHDDDGSLPGELARLKEAWLRGSQSDAGTAVAASEIARRWLQWRAAASGTDTFSAAAANNPVTRANQQSYPVPAEKMSVPLPAKDLPFGGRGQGEGRNSRTGNGKATVTIYRTTADWAALVRHWNVAAIHPIVDVLELADRVKFAQAEPLEEVRDSLERLRQVMLAPLPFPVQVPSPAASEGDGRVRGALSK
jgi:hypothetical protein